MDNDAFAPRCPFCSVLLPTNDPTGEKHTCGTSNDPDQVRQWLDLAYPAGDRAERFHIGVLAADGRWTGHSVDRDQVAAKVAELEETTPTGIYLGACTYTPEAGSRRRATDTAYLYGLWSDIDIAGPGHKPTSMPLPPDETAARAIVAEAGLPDPTVWIHSGGGLYAWWLLDEPVPAQDHADLSRRWQAALAAGAHALGYHYGTGVSDLARVLRIPGTVNRKIPNQPRPCRILSSGGARYTIESLQMFAEQAASEEKTTPPSGNQFTTPGGQQHTPDEDTPLNAFEKATDWAEILEPHGWRLARTEGRTRYWVRPHKDTPGHSMTTGRDPGRDRAYCFSDAAGLPVNTPMTKGYVYALLNFGGDINAAARHLHQQGFGARHENTTPTTDHTDHTDFWTARPALATIRDLARQRHVGPWALLAAVLAMMSTRVGPHVVLPPIVGSIASLNTFWALVGASGAGKDAAIAVAEEILGFNDNVPTHEVGTGQGIDSTYTRPVTKGQPVQFCDSALFTITEIDSLRAHASMSGANIMATLRKVYTGSALGARYADRDRRRPVKAHRYRAAVIAGVQPSRCGVLLDDADGGTPQRWLWMPTNDPHRDTQTNYDITVEHGVIWQQYQHIAPDGDTELGGGEGRGVTLKRRIEIEVCDTARDTIINYREERLRAPLTAPDGDLSGHLLLTRLKVAALLALFDNCRTKVTDEDWELAGVVIEVSEATREVCARELKRQREQLNTAQAAAEVRREEFIRDHSVNRVAKVLEKVLKEAGRWMRRAELRRSITSRDRGHFEEAIRRLIEADRVMVDQSDDGKGERYRANSS